MKLADQVGQLVGCNVGGRLRHIRSLVEAIPGDVAPLPKSTKRGLFLEIDRLLRFIDPDNVTSPGDPMNTPNYYDPAWVIAINTVLENREEKLRIKDINEPLWDEFIGPMIDAIIDRHDADAEEVALVTYKKD